MLAFNSCKVKGKLRFKKLPTNMAFDIFSAKRVPSKFGGTSILVELANVIVYLPDRFSDIGDDLWSTISNGAYYLIKHDDGNIYIDLKSNLNNNQ